METASVLVLSVFPIGAKPLRVGAGSRLAKPSRSDARRAAYAHCLDGDDERWFARMEQALG